MAVLIIHQMLMNTKFEMRMGESLSLRFRRKRLGSKYLRYFYLLSPLIIITFRALLFSTVQLKTAIFDLLPVFRTFLVTGENSHMICHIPYPTAPTFFCMLQKSLGYFLVSPPLYSDIILGKNPSLYYF